MDILDVELQFEPQTCLPPQVVQKYAIDFTVYVAATAKLVITTWYQHTRKHNMSLLYQ